MVLAAVMGFGVSGAGADLVRLARLGALRRIVVLRHADFGGASLTAAGLGQCWHRRLSPELRDPTPRRVLCASSAQARQSARHIAPRAETHVLQSVWPLRSAHAAEIGAAMEALGDRAPLLAFWNHAGGSLRPALQAYAVEVWREALLAVDGHLERDGGSLVIVSHGVLTSAVAHLAAALLGWDDRVVREAVVGAACGFVLEPGRERRIGGGTKPWEFTRGNTHGWTCRYVE